MQEFNARGDDAFPGHGNLPPSAAELKRLERENKQLRLEREILKKRQPSSSILAADRNDDDDKPIAVSDARALVGEQLWVVGFHEVGLKLLEEFGFNKLFPKARSGLWRLFAQMVLMRLAEPGASKRRAVARLRSHFGVNVPLHRVYRMMDAFSEGFQSCTTYSSTRGAGFIGSQV